ncbi:hypothetical protein DFH09DRAFT_1275035 [Mycena vulgaris]|nr:hypothetical protein DFH09DRAFT_1275035 [Mycena vulgaris]
MASGTQPGRGQTMGVQRRRRHGANLRESRVWGSIGEVYLQVYNKLVRDAKFQSTHLLDHISYLQDTTFEALHDYGIDHGGLNSSDDIRHAIIDVHAPGLAHTDLLDGKAPCHIVHFSDARANHQSTLNSSVKTPTPKPS